MQRRTRQSSEQYRIRTALGSQNRHRKKIVKKILNHHQMKKRKKSRLLLHSGRSGSRRPQLLAGVKWPGREDMYGFRGNKKSSCRALGNNNVKRMNLQRVQH